MSFTKRYFETVVEEIGKQKAKGKEVREGETLLIKCESVSGTKEVEHKVTKADLEMEKEWASGG